MSAARLNGVNYVSRSLAVLPSSVNQFPTSLLFYKATPSPSRSSPQFSRFSSRHTCAFDRKKVREPVILTSLPFLSRFSLLLSPSQRPLLPQEQPISRFEVHELGSVSIIYQFLLPDRLQMTTVASAQYVERPVIWV